MFADGMDRNGADISSCLEKVCTVPSGKRVEATVIVPFDDTFMTLPNDCTGRINTRCWLKIAGNGLYAFKASTACMNHLFMCDLIFGNIDQLPENALYSSSKCTKRDQIGDCA
eukprot:TRINITY_DN6417_c0_g1_i3.p2 TRINITY_DN6417_c0_g1~~TRINITY_DN6417_c0_g1_i3.p2  ORF type:complete len:113 (+),score=7.90 TRINITY_DN6417_c0_g1_i3:636-974(+)